MLRRCTMSRSTCSPLRRCGSNEAASRRAVSVWRRSRPSRSPPGSTSRRCTRARSISIPETRAGAALRRIAGSCAAQIVRNEAAVLAGMPEGVHQMRVGVRRLRAILSAFAKLLPNGEHRRLSDELRWLGGVLGVARNLDVFAGGLVVSAAELDRRRARSRGARRRHCPAPRGFVRRGGRGDRFGALRGPRIAPDALVGRKRRRQPIIGAALASPHRHRSPYYEAPLETGAAARRRVREAVAGKAPPAADRAQKTALYGGSACSAMRIPTNPIGCCGRSSGCRRGSAMRTMCACRAISWPNWRAAGLMRRRSPGPVERCSSGTGGV